MARTASRSAAPFEKKSLHDPVFERVERHDAQASALSQEAFRSSESQLEFIEFIVDEYPQGLKYARRRMPLARSAFCANRLCDNLRQLGCPLKRLQLALSDHGAGYTTGGRFLSVPPDYIRQILLACGVDKVGRRLALAAHPHIERPIAGE